MVNRSAPGARLEDIAACEAAIGARLPQWLKAELLKHNGWVRAKWKFLPVRNYETHRVEPQSIEGQTWAVRTLGVEVEPGSVVIAWDTTVGRSRCLVLTPSTDCSGDLGPLLRIHDGQNCDGEEPFTYEDLCARKAGMVSRPQVMSSTDLPLFRYFPDPVFNGSFLPEPVICECCGYEREWKYYTSVLRWDRHDEREVESLCPWCIADDRGRQTWQLVFVWDFDYRDGEPGKESFKEVSCRTPCYPSWQRERWRVHCREMMAFMGHVGWEDVKDNPSVCTSVEHHADILDMMIPGGMINGLLFECLRCETQVLSIDCG